MDKVAIVILNWNGRQMMERYLPSVIDYSREEATVYVADNASTDDSVEWLKKHYPEVRLVLLDRNWGFAEGYNKALEQIEADYYLLLNSDVEVTPHWLTPMLAFMEQHDEVAACQPKLLSVTNKNRFEYAGASGGYIDKYGYPFCRGRIFDTVEADNGQYDHPVEVLWATGACLLIRSKDYWQVDGLDGRFFAHCEEIDLCWRLHIRGRQVWCLPDSCVYHLGGGTLPQGNPRKTFLNFRNSLTMLYKNLPDADLHRVLCMRWWLDYIAAFKALLVDRNVGDFKAICRARREYRRWRHDFDDVRKKNQASRMAHHSMPDRKSYSVLWQYYVKRKKFFSQL